MYAYIDGENFRHRLVEGLKGARLLENGHTPFRFNVPALITKVLGQRPIQINYYTSRVKQPTFPIPDKLAEQIDTISEINRRWIADLTNEGVNVIKAGFLKVHDSTRCIHCGEKTQILQEKGVDVRLATDMVLAAAQEHITHIILFSSDADMIPAIDHCRQNNTKVTYVCFEEELNKGVSAACDETLTYSRQDIIDVYNGVQA
ncbi:MAG: hypothetical protein JWO41_257 [Candidatus Saccharibacteria bacterium]|nr:hypothetical protein [Candidatus Saccharibacteria bacterium]